MASAAAVVAVEMGGGDCGGEAVVGGDDLTRFLLINLNFFKYCIFTIALKLYSEILLIHFLQASFHYKQHLKFSN